MSCYGADFKVAHALLQKHSFQGLELLFKSSNVPYGTCWCVLADNG